MLVPVDRMGWIIPEAGERSRVGWQNPPRSPTALTRRHGPAAGTTRSLTAVSSIPLAAADDQCVGWPRSAAVTSSLPYTVAPVPNITWAGSNGSIATDAIHQPNLGAVPQARNGEAEMSSFADTPTSVQVAPASVERKTVSTGNQRSLVATIT